MRIFRVLLFVAFSLPHFAHGGSFSVKESEATKSPEQGWNFGFNLGVDYPNFDFSKAVPGVDDTTSMHLGGKIGGNILFLSGAHEWENQLSYTVAYNLSQFLDDFVKTRDKIVFETNYYYSFFDWMGMYARAHFDTNLLPGRDLQPYEVVYEVYDHSGNLVTTTPPVKNYELTSAFKPMMFEENLGFFTRPIREKYLSFELRASGALVQGLSEGEEVVTDHNFDVDPEVVSIEPLDNFVSFGIGLGTEVWGIVVDRVQYKGKVDVGYSLYDSANTKEIPNNFQNNSYLDAGVELRLRIFDWLGITWEGTARYQPYIFDTFQFASNFNLDLNYDF